MKLLKKVSSIFLALIITVITSSFVSAASVSKEPLQKFLKKFPMGNPETYNSNNMPYLEKYPKVVDALSQFLIDVKADENDFDNNNKDSLSRKLYSFRIKQDVLQSNSRYNNMLIFMAYVSVFNDYNFVSGYKYREGISLFGPMHFCYMLKIIDNNGNEKFDFIWVDKDECKKTVKQMMDGTFDIDENYFWKGRFKNDDHDLLFLKHVQNAVIKYFGDIDSFFDDEEFSTIFFKTMFEVITDNGKSPSNDQKMISIVSSNSSEEIDDYKTLGHNIIKKSLEYRGLEEEKDYAIEYDDVTGYVKSIKQLSNKDLKGGVIANYLTILLIVAGILFALFVIAVIVIVVVILTRKR